MSRDLLERDPELADLRTTVREATAGRGRVVLLHGEAGIGKTSLVNALRADPPDGVRVLIGSCDAMSTPRTLGPLRDLAPSVGPRLGEALRAGDREEVFTALRDELTVAPGTVLIVEDAHWADEATLDVLRFLARRIDDLPAVVVLTYRDELDRDHPLNRLLGDLGHGDRVERIALHHLSAAAVGALTAGSGLDARSRLRDHRGEPVLRQRARGICRRGTGPADGRRRGDRAPPAARRHDAGSRRAARRRALGGRSRPARPARAGVRGALRAAEEGGLLAVSPDGVRFRHELTRHAIVDALPTSRRIELEHRVFVELLRSGVADPARLVHHAMEAGDVDAIVEWAPRAARDAAASGAHRQATAHYRAALDHADRYQPAELADLSEEFAIESYTIGAALDAVVAQSEAVALRRQLDDPPRLGSSLRWLSRFQWFGGRRADAEASAREASAVLAVAGDWSLLAMALSNESQLALLAHDSERAIELADGAIAIARETGDSRVLSHALNNHGTALMFRADDAGIAELIEAAEVALAVDDVEDAARASVNLVWALLDQYRLDLAEDHLARAMELTERAEFIGFAGYQRMEQGRLDLARARWDDALSAVEPLPEAPHARCVALTVAGTVQLRRGDDGADPRSTKRGASPTTSANCSGADLSPRLARRPPCCAATTPPHARSPARSSTRPTTAPRAPSGAELAYLLRRAATTSTWRGTTGIRSPFRPGGSGAVPPTCGARRVRRTTRPRRSPRAPMTRTSSTRSRSSIASALSRSHGASGRTSATVASEHPARAVEPTRRNPEGLTDRQVDVLRLLAEGLTNAEIAERLVVSVRTVDSHVAAVLAKLGVASRQDAVRAATSSACSRRELRRSR